MWGSGAVQVLACTFGHAETITITAHAPLLNLFSRQVEVNMLCDPSPVWKSPSIAQRGPPAAVKSADMALIYSARTIKPVEHHRKSYRVMNDPAAMGQDARRGRRSASDDVVDPRSGRASECRRSCGRATRKVSSEPRQNHNTQNPNWYIATTRCSDRIGVLEAFNVH
jgi:hypothetical protein